MLHVAMAAVQNVPEPAACCGLWTHQWDSTNVVTPTVEPSWGPSPGQMQAYGEQVGSLAYSLSCLVPVQASEPEPKKSKKGKSEEGKKKKKKSKGGDAVAASA